MGKTVTMRKGDRFADIFDSPETIAQAQKDGYHLCAEDELEARSALRKADAKKQAEEKPDDELNIVSRDDSVKSLSELGKDELLEFASKKKIYSKSFKGLEQDALVQKILETVKARVVEAKLKTAEEAAALTEADLLALFDTIGK